MSLTAPPDWRPGPGDTVGVGPGPDAGHRGEGGAAVGRAGALPATGDVVRAHGAFVWRTLRHLGVPEADCDDATQEVFLVVHRRRDTFDGTSSVRTWLYGIAQRVASGARRTHLRRREDAHAPATLPDASQPAEQEAHAERMTQRALAHALLGELDEDKRMVFVLHDLEELSVAEIAAALGCPPKTIYSRLYAAREALLRGVRRAQATGRIR